jgi:hypothetical protein
MVYHIDFKTKKLVPLETTGLPLGAVVSYGDQANPRRRAVVTRIDADPSGYGQPCIYIESLHKTTVSKSAIDGPGGWRLEPDEVWTVPQIQDLEARANKLFILEQENRELKAQLAKKTCDEAKTKGAPKVPAGAKYVIVANRMKDDSDSQSDYFNSKTEESILLAFSKHGRDNFAEMRKAAATFEPTKHLGPGRGVFTARVILQNDIGNCNGSAYWKGTRSHWHRELDNDAGIKFETRTEAEYFIAHAPAPESISFDGVVGAFAWDIDEDEIEHREKWSMGHGYYLKAGGRHSTGWEVRKEERSPDAIAYLIGAGKYRPGLV